MTTEALAIERNLWVQCQRCGGLTVPAHLDDCILDADPYRETGWRCLTCDTPVPLERTMTNQRQSGREGERVPGYFSTITHTRRVA